MIREAQMADVPELVAMGEHFVAQTSYGTHLPANPAQMTALCERLIADPTGAMFVSEVNGVLTGMFGVFLFVHPMSGELLASEVVWWTEPQFRGHGVRLIKHAERWATDHGAVRMQMVAPTWDVEQLYQRFGYSRVEVAYQRTLQ